MSSEEIAKRVSDPKFTPRIFASKGHSEDWWTTSLAALARLGGVARPGQIAQMARGRDALSSRLLSRLRQSGLVTFTELRQIGGRPERWVALDDRHPCMAELREALLVIGRRLTVPPPPTTPIVVAPPPPYGDAAPAEMGAFFGDASRTRLLSIVAHVAPVGMTDLARYAAVTQQHAYKTTYRLALGGLVSIYHSGDERGRAWITLNRDADYSEAIEKLIVKVASFQNLPFAGLKKANDAKIARLYRERTASAALLDRLVEREKILDT